MEDLKLIYLVGLTIANDNTMPVWNKGDEFEAFAFDLPEGRLKNVGVTGILEAAGRRNVPVTTMKTESSTYESL